MIRMLNTTRLRGAGCLSQAKWAIRETTLGRGDLPRRLAVRPFTSTVSWRAIVPFKLHDIGEGIAEVEMLDWKVEVGQRVDHFDDLCEVQSDKST